MGEWYIAVAELLCRPNQRRCIACGGTKKVKTRNMGLYEPEEYSYVDCPSCHGTGVGGSLVRGNKALKRVINGK